LKSDFVTVGIDPARGEQSADAIVNPGANDLIAGCYAMNTPRSIPFDALW